MDIPRIYHGYHDTSNDIPCISMDIPRIYLVPGYTWYIHGYTTGPLARTSTPLDIRGHGTISMDIRVYPMYIMISVSLRTAYTSTWDIHGLSHVYTRNRGSRCLSRYYGGR
jgi:hypothetical protein